MKKNLEQNKEELIVDLLSTCCANNLPSGINNFVNRVKEKLLSLPAASGPVKMSIVS